MFNFIFVSVHLFFPLLRQHAIQCIYMNIGEFQYEAHIERRNLNH